MTLGEQTKSLVPQEGSLHYTGISAGGDRHAAPRQGDGMGREEMGPQ